ncbi:glucosidase II beta subunit-like protein [Ancylostoma caninum]|uniref:Endoplasmic reticulum lectin 1 n=1 Tax=Ancylostoma caninum TaxID=29170 RepID=A0A368GRQ2_ANCCA|nr:glucosidase II beta subunit-like protein [Ancylostoma caninum]
MLPRRISILILVLGGFSYAAKVDDSVHYLITFERADSGLEGGQLLEDNEKALKDDNSLRISTQNNENYICKMPEAPKTRAEDISTYTGPTPVELLAPVYKEKLCSYRVEPYWSYELCHGRYIVQYHEEKDVRGVGRTAEYYLGNLHVDYTTVASSTDYNNPPKRVIDGEEHAYFPVFYSQGTTCDITGKPRTTTVMYICIENARNQIHSLNEVSSCNYEVIVLSSRLCTHPAYKRKARHNQEIICYNTDNNENSKPLSLVQMEAYHRDTFKREYAIKEQPQQSDTQADDEKFDKGIEEPVTEQPLKLAGKKRHEGVDSLANNRLIVEDTVNRILSGRECIYGGEGWWKYEFCYGKSVVQYHIEQNGERTEILLGVFDEKIHKAWIDDDPKQRSPRKYNGQIMQVSHIYTKGSMCHEVRAHRNVEVRLRCKTAEGSPLAISLSLSEPKLCQYILTIESERFCEPLQYADEYGLIALEPHDAAAERLPGPI